MPYTPKIRYGGELKHYRTKGSRNGIRRYQNLDGSLTAAGYARYGVDPNYLKKIAAQKRITENIERQKQQQQARINAAARTNSGANGVASREAAQRSGNRINANNYGNALSNKIGRTQAAVSNKAKKAAQDVSRTASNVGRNVSNASRSAGNWLHNTTAPARNTVGTAYNNVSSAVRGAADNVGNWVGDRREELEEKAKKAKKKAREAANSILGSKSKRNEYNTKADEYARKAQNPVRSMGYISDTKYAKPSTWFDKDAGLTGRDYSQQIADQHRVYASKEAEYRQKAKEETFKGKAEKAGRNAGNWLTDRIGDVKKAVSGAANNVGEAASNAAKKVKEAADSAGDKAREVGGNAGNWFTDRIGDVKKAVSGAANNVGEAASNAAKKVKEAADSAGDKAREAASNAAKKAKEAADRAGDKAKKAASDVSDWATKGRQYQAEAEKYEKKLKDDTDDERYLAKLQREGDARVNQNALNKKAADSAKTAKSASQKASDYVHSWGNNRITANDSKSLGREDSQRIGSIANKLAGDAAKANAQAKKDKKERDYWANLNRQGDEEYGNRAKAYAGRAATARQKYNNSLAGQVDKAKTTASNAANRVKDAYSNSILGKSDKAIIEGVRNAGRNVGKAASNAASQIQTTAAESKRRAEQFIENFFGGNKKKKKKK